MSEQSESGGAVSTDDSLESVERFGGGAAVGYATTADELVQRILALIPGNPHIMDMDNPFDLNRVNGFKCDDLQPSFFQVSWALGKAKLLHKRATTVA